ncbi:MAG: hypothetical protein PQJ59_16915 [Spirochaetales bacterium]|nr:hypothetical protein [Spirochaetales bacterium]
MAKPMTEEKKVWRDLKRRCYMPNTYNYSYYEPDNCRWVTIKENCRNKSTNVISQEDVENMRSLREQGFKYREISEKLNIKYSHVADVLSGRRWAD